MGRHCQWPRSVVFPPRTSPWPSRVPATSDPRGRSGSHCGPLGVEGPATSSVERAARPSILEATIVAFDRRSARPGRRARACVYPSAACASCPGTSIERRGSTGGTSCRTTLTLALHGVSSQLSVPMPASAPSRLCVRRGTSNIRQLSLSRRASTVRIGGVSPGPKRFWCTAVAGWGVEMTPPTEKDRVRTPLHLAEGGIRRRRTGHGSAAARYSCPCTRWTMAGCLRA